jgi:hypothetical protein
MAASMVGYYYNGSGPSSSRATSLTETTRPDVLNSSNRCHKVGNLFG